MFTNRRAVLHVDDDPQITAIVGSHLRKADFDFEAVHDSREAIETLTKGHYRIVVLDEDMPHVTGLEILQEIKRIDAGVQVIMLTGLVDEQTVFDANRYGAEACLFKPLTDPQLLVDAAEDAFRRNDDWWRSLHDLNQRRRAEEAHAVS